MAGLTLSKRSVPPLNAEYANFLWLWFYIQLMKLPDARTGTTEDIAAFVSHVASPQSKFMTGMHLKKFTWILNITVWEMYRTNSDHWWWNLLRLRTLYVRNERLQVYMVICCITAIFFFPVWVVKNLRQYQLYFRSASQELACTRLYLFNFGVRCVSCSPTSDLILVAGCYLSHQILDP